MQKKTSKMLMITVVISTIFYSGCGGESTKTSGVTPSKIVKENRRISTYINKGNFVEVANFAYKRAIDPNFTQYAMDIQLPGSNEDEIAKSSAYNVTMISIDKRLKKIVVENYQNSLELKIVDQDSVNILFKDVNFTVDRQMSLADFKTLR